MWLFTTYGFFSVVAYAVKRYNSDPKTGYTRAVDSTRVAVRARNPAHLKNLLRAFPDLQTNVIETDQADYCCRLIVAKELWLSVATQLAEEINYDNFKDECHEQLDLDSKYIAGLHEVWSILYGYQQSRTKKLARRRAA